MLENKAESWVSQASFETWKAAMGNVSGGKIGVNRRLGLYLIDMPLAFPPMRILLDRHASNWRYSVGLSQIEGI